MLAIVLGVRAWLLGSVAVVVGCGGGHDDPDAPPSGDGGGDGGLALRFVVAQAVPGEVGPTLTVERVRFHADTVRAIGDAAPGDARTTAADVRLYWESGDQPDRIRFDTAPAGLYSSVELRLDEGDDEEEHTYELVGEVELDAVWYEYEIESERPLTIGVDTATALEPGGTAEIVVAVDVAAILGAIDFASYPRDGGSISIEGVRPEIDAAVTAGFGAGIEATHAASWP